MFCFVFNFESSQAACERGGVVSMNVICRPRPTWGLLLDLPSENQAGPEERWTRSTMAGNDSLYAAFLGILNIQSLCWKTASYGYWGMMTIKGRIAVHPSAVCSLCGCTMTTFPEANHWSDLSNIRIEALYFGQAFQEGIPRELSYV